MNKIIYALIFAAIVVIGGVVYILNSNNSSDYQANNEPADAGVPAVEDVTEPEPEAEPEPEPRGASSVIGQSVEGADISAYHFGEGDKEVLFVSGIHGGYSYNTSLVAYELIEHLEANPSSVPEGITVTVIPVLNPDGLSKVVDHDGKAFAASDVSSSQTDQVAGRFNGNEVDLNRNFDCQWDAEGTWQNKTVSGGTEAFSEPESKAVQAYLDEYDVVGVVTYYSAAGGVYASQCGDSTLPETVELTAVYAEASGYSANAEFDFYEITGDMVNWFAKQRVPAISVLLTDRSNPEWTKNLAGIEAVLAYFAE